MRETHSLLQWNPGKPLSLNAAVTSLGLVYVRIIESVLPIGPSSDIIPYYLISIWGLIPSPNLLAIMYIKLPPEKGRHTHTHTHTHTYIYIYIYWKYMSHNYRIKITRLLLGLIDFLTEYPKVNEEVPAANFSRTITLSLAESADAAEFTDCISAEL